MIGSYFAIKFSYVWEQYMSQKHRKTEMNRTFIVRNIVVNEFGKSYKI